MISAQLENYLRGRLRDSQAALNALREHVREIVNRHDVESELATDAMLRHRLQGFLEEMRGELETIVALEQLLELERLRGVQ